MLVKTFTCLKYLWRYLINESIKPMQLKPRYVAQVGLNDNRTISAAAFR